jgi:hypothetical protein
LTTNKMDVSSLPSVNSAERKTSAWSRNALPEMVFKSFYPGSQMN